VLIIVLGYVLEDVLVSFVGFSKCVLIKSLQKRKKKEKEKEDRLIELKQKRNNEESLIVTLKKIVERIYCLREICQKQDN